MMDYDDRTIARIRFEAVGHLPDSAQILGVCDQLVAVRRERDAAKLDYATMLKRSDWWMRQAEKAQDERDAARRERDIAQVRLARLILIKSQPVEMLETEQEYNERILSEIGDVLARVREEAGK